MTNHRRVPHWLRAFSQPSLHGLTGKLVRENVYGDLSRRQEWLLDRCFEELAWRTTAVPRWAMCTCELCMDACALLTGLELADEEL
jgi:hypothetical protein